MTGAEQEIVTSRSVDARHPVVEFGIAHAHVLLALVSVLVALAYVGLVPAGQPYDEPAHWSNVQYYADHARMPELGTPGVSYEAQQGPVFYALAAVIARPTEAIFSEKAAFYAVRVADALLVGVAVLLTYVLAMSLMPRRRGVALLAAAFVGLNPFLLAIGSSVQNDYLSMVLGLGALLVAVRAMKSPSRSWGKWFVAGVLVALASLTKVFAGGLLVAFGAGVVWAKPSERRERFVGWLIAGLGFVVVSGWWFVRSLALYGDVTGEKGVEAAGFHYSALVYTGPGSIGSWIRSLVAYLWVPTEYYRNAFSAPLVMRAVVVAITLAIGVAAIVGIRRIRAERSMSDPVVSWLSVVGASWFIITFIIYAGMAWTVRNLAPRLVFVALPAAVVLVCAWCDVVIRHRRARLGVGAALVAVLLIISVFVLVKVNEIGPMPFTIHFG
jgi:uncharacterized membrane protein